MTQSSQASSFGRPKPTGLSAPRAGCAWLRVSRPNHREMSSPDSADRRSEHRKLQLNNFTVQKFGDGYAANRGASELKGEKHGGPSEQSSSALIR